MQHEALLKATYQERQREHQSITEELMRKLDMLYKGYCADYQTYLNDRQSWLEREAEYLRRFPAPASCTPTAPDHTRHNAQDDTALACSLR